MRQVNRFDPAPSRLRYRLHRMMLTPVYRLALRVGLPMALSFGLASLWFAQEDNRTAFLARVTDLRSAVEERPEFMVKLMAIDGASDGVAEEIRAVVPVNFPVSSFDLDLPAMRRAISGLDAVESARIFLRKGGVLQVDVSERVPVALWRHDGALKMIDASGVFVGPADARIDHPELPVIAGEGADQAVPEALKLAAAAGPLGQRLRGFVRVGERRWDVVLDRDQRILLPAEGAVRALERAVAMDEAVDMLARDLTVVDLRLPQRPTLRMTEYSQKEMWRIKAIEAGDKH
ncbi:cell division protein FtsQ/DivIB [Litorisediminicola beolgyonensis]|uniref:Cell division protein FtsQ n=1 Tax=Litorisediminicola beolgyonensis TaxID=1173614 RepID=A0ABW3ZPY3_9RHOB